MENQNTMIPLRMGTRKRLRMVCKIEGRTYDGLISKLLDLYFK